MPRRKMTPSEILVGRRLPPEASYRDQLLARHIHPGGGFCSVANPVDRWLLPAFSKIRKEGLVRMGLRISFGGRPGKNDGLWSLTEKGQAEAVAAFARVREANAARKAWSCELLAAHQERRAAASEPADS